MQIKGMEMRLFRKLLFGFIYIAVVLGGAIASVTLLDPTDMPIVKAAISSKMLTYGIAVMGVILAEIVVCWRFKIDVTGAFNVVEQNPIAIAIFMGALTVGNCLLAAAVFG